MIFSAPPKRDVRRCNNVWHDELKSVFSLCSSFPCARSLAAPPCIHTQQTPHTLLVHVDFAVIVVVRSRIRGLTPLVVTQPTGSLRYVNTCVFFQFEFLFSQRPPPSRKSLLATAPFPVFFRGEFSLRQ